MDHFNETLTTTGAQQRRTAHRHRHLTPTRYVSRVLSIETIEFGRSKGRLADVHVVVFQGQLMCFRFATGGADPALAFEDFQWSTGHSAHDLVHEIPTKSQRWRPTRRLRS